MAKRQQTLIIQPGGERRVTLKPRKANLVAIPFRIVGFVAGVFGVIMAIAFSITIIGLIVGVPLWFGAAAMIAISVNPSKQRVKCPCGGNRNLVANSAESFICTRCKQVVLVDWEA